MAATGTTAWSSSLSFLCLCLTFLVNNSCSGSNAFTLLQQNRAIFGVGKRIEGDELLVRDVLRTPGQLTQTPVISFNYDVSEFISYIEVSTDKNAVAKVSFSYDKQLVTGTVTALELSNDRLHRKGRSSKGHSMKSFEVSIEIYGWLKRTNPAIPADLLLQGGQRYSGVLKRKRHAAGPAEKTRALRRDSEHKAEEVKEVKDEADNSGESGETYYEEEEEGEEADREKEEEKHESENEEDDDVSEKELDDYEDTEEDDDDDDDNDDDELEEEEFSGHLDKIIDLGERQTGDYLLYETYQASPDQTVALTNHSIVFYYIDGMFITYVHFILFDHFATRNPTDENYKAPIAEYSYISPTTLKAVITDFETTSLFVLMQIYGYKAKDLPVDTYVAYMPNMTMKMPEGVWQGQTSNSNDSSSWTEDVSSTAGGNVLCWPNINPPPTSKGCRPAFLLVPASDNIIRVILLQLLALIVAQSMHLF